MNTRRTLFGVAWLVVALWALAAFSASKPELYPSIVPADCGQAPVYDSAHEDEWYAYGDCSGDYGPIDGAQ
jgi:hypothetical protein